MVFSIHSRVKNPPCSSNTSFIGLKHCVHSILMKQNSKAKTPPHHLQHSTCWVVEGCNTKHRRILQKNAIISLETLHVFLHFLRHPNLRARVGWPISRCEDLHVQIHLPTLVELEHRAVAELRLKVVRVRGHQISAQVDVLEHAFQLGREGASTLRLS